MARIYKELRGITIGTTAELAAHTAIMGDDQAAYNTETGQLMMGPGTIASKATGVKGTLVAGDYITIRDSEDGGKTKLVLASVAKTYFGS